MEISRTSESPRRVPYEKTEDPRLPRKVAEKNIESRNLVVQAQIFANRGLGVLVT